MRLKLVQSLLIIGTCLFVIQCGDSGSASESYPQPSPTPAYTAVTNSNSAVSSSAHDDGEIEGKPTDLVAADSTLKSILKQPAPDIWFVFACRNQTDAACSEGKTKKELPVEVKKLVEVYWKNCLDYQYKIINEQFKNAQEGSNGTALHINSGTKFKKQVEKLIVEAPNGERNISGMEAQGIVALLNKNAKVTVEEIQAKYGVNL